jgi:hypothetical protein
MPRYDNLSDEELEHIRRFIEDEDVAIDALTDELRDLVEQHWPWLLVKLPLQPRRT